MKIDIKNLTKCFGDKLLFDDFSYTFTEGQPTCILGESGCGKTTLLQMILGLEKPDEGCIEKSPGRISTVFQEDRLCEAFNPYVNIRMVCPEATHEEIDAELSRLGFKLTHQSVSTLSGGEKRRVALVRAAMYGGDLFILDEAFRGLDPQTRMAAMEYMKEKSRGKTCIIVTHDEQEAAFWGGNILKL